MDDNETRMEIILDHYKAYRNQSGLPQQEDNEKLRKIDKKDYDFNYAYLAKHGIIAAQPLYASGVEIFTPLASGISGPGMDIAEKFIDSCVENAEKTTGKIISKSLSHLEKIGELVTLWSKSTELLQQALELLSHLLGS